MAKDKAYKQAEQKIAEALKTGATELELRSMNLTELPESIGQLKQLRKLHLGVNTRVDHRDQNQLTTLPDSLGQLKQLTELNLSYNRLTTLPDSLRQLTQLRELNLSDNKITILPDSLGQLTQLRELNLSDNKITILPEWVGNFIFLQYFNISGNLLEILPEAIGRLVKLEEIGLNFNRLIALPESIGNLLLLTELRVIGNRLNELPISIGNLQSLKRFFISRNNIKYLPESFCKLINLENLHFGVDKNGNPLGQIPNCIQFFSKLNVLSIAGCQVSSVPEWINQLAHLSFLDLNHNQVGTLPLSLHEMKSLKRLDLKDNPLNPALQSAYEAGLDAVKAYLRSLEGNAEPLYEAKLVLVGEGGVGKTTLLNALMNKEDRAPKKDETTTHGVKIDVNALQVSHPVKEDINIQLNAWDFGGQEVYRVTHQFFFSRRSLYLLVWEPRRGVQQCQVEDWLNMIRLRVGDEARVIIVSTNSKSGGHIARIDQPVFKQQYGDMIVGFHEVDSLVSNETTGEMVGIAELKKIIAEESIKFNHVGMLFNNDWKVARNELIARSEAHIRYSTFAKVCAKHKLSEIDTITLAAIMNDLGYIVHYSDDEKLRDDVVLKPEWLTKAIGFVLEDRATAESEGILPDKHLYEIWHNHKFKDEPRYKPDLYPFFLRLMEKYDVSYRLPDDRKASLVAQHVPQVRPELPWLPEQEPPKDQRRIAMVCAMEEDPPGLVPWMIVRTHDYSVEQGNHHLHWQKGMFLNHGTHGEAMLEKRDREFHIYAQAAWPEHFMNVLHSTLEKLINDNWPGLKDRYRFMVPCPELTDGQPCKGRFNIHTLRQFLAEGDSTIRCQECTKKQLIAELLLGFEERDMSVQLREIQEQLTRAQKQIAGLDSRIANYFWATMQAIADEGKSGPRLFTFHSLDARLSPKEIFMRPISLQFWCEAEGCQHPVIEDGKGLYSINRPYEWVMQIAPYANFALDVLKTVVPIATPAINTFFGEKTTETWGITDQLSLAGAIISKLQYEVKTPDKPRLQRGMISESERSGILSLHRLLNELDPTQDKLGLHRATTYTGDFRWLCKRHYDAYQPTIPDFIEISGTHEVKKTIHYDVILIYAETDLEITNNLSRLLEKRQLRVFRKNINDLLSLENKEARDFIKSGKSFAFVISNEMLTSLSKMKNRPAISLITESNIPIIAVHLSEESTEQGTKKLLKDTRNIDLSFGYRSEQIDKWEYWITGETPPKTKGMTWIDWLFNSGFEEDLSYLKPLEGELSLTPTRIRLRNIRSFIDSEVINLDKSKDAKPHTLLLGDNSSGKSTILQCITLAYLGSEKANSFGASGISPSSYLRHDTKTGYIEVEFRIDNNSVELPFIENTFVVGLKIEKGENRFEAIRTDLTLSNWNANDKLNILRARNNDQFGFICGYGPWRTLASDPKSLWSEAQIPVVDRISSLFDSNYILGHPDVVGKMLVGDFSNFRNAPKENRDKVFLRKIDELICKLLPNTNRSETDKEFSLELNHVPISIQSMSDGYRSIMSIVGHLLYHSLSRKQWQGDPSDISGTIIIDEIDLHLHPAWQRFVFSSITDAFPNLNIIASSHSPLVASSVDSESIIVLDKDGDHINIIADPISVKGWRSDQILASELFGYVIDSDPAVEEVLRQASILAGKGEQRTVEEERQYKKIKNELQEIFIEDGQTLIEREIESEHYERVRQKIKALEQKYFRGKQ